MWYGIPLFYFIEDWSNTIEDMMNEYSEYSIM